MKLLPGAEMIECGVDWITVTATDRDAADRLVREGDRLLCEAQSLGDVVRVFRWKGYEGWCVDGVDVARRADSGIVRLHGATADRDWWEVFQEGTNVTRLDLQQTWRISGETVDHLLARAWRAVQKTKLYGKPVEWHYRRDRVKGNTLEYGRRVSEKFGRCYNKGYETKLDHYRECFRMEVEAKGDTAWRWTKSLGTTGSVRENASRHVWSFFADRGLESGTPGVESVSLDTPPRTRDVDRYLAWLATAIRPGVQRALDQRGLDAVLTALGLTDMVQSNPELD